MTPGAQAQTIGLDDHASASAGAMHFELPALPLAQALQTYSRTANVAVVALNRQLDGRISTPVVGDYAPHEALQRLLAGTGFEPDFTGADEAIIVPLAAAPKAASAPPSWTIAASAIDGVSDDREYRAYAALVQTRLTEALCDSPQTRPGSYRLVAQLRIDVAGSVVAAKVVGSTGLLARDAAIEEVLRALVFDAAPPPGLPEPITILMHPDGNGVHTDCTQPGERG